MLSNFMLRHASSSILAILMILNTASANSDIPDYLPDPTKPSIAKAAKVQEKATVSEKTYSLQSIIMSAGKRAAVINGEYVKEGSVIGKALVRDISAQAVTLEYDGRLAVLKLFKNQGIKRQP